MLVLGLTALAASVPPPERRPATPVPPPPAAEAGAARPLQVRLDAARPRPAAAALPRDRRAVISVRVPGGGLVAVEGLGLTAFADERTPAVFDVFTTRAGRHPVTFRPTGGRPERVGLLIVRR